MTRDVFVYVGVLGLVILITQLQPTRVAYVVISIHNSCMIGTSWVSFVAFDVYLSFEIYVHGCLI